MAETERDPVRTAQTTEVAIEVVRLIRLRAHETENLPPRVVAHVVVSDRSNTVSAFGQVDLRTPSEQAKAAGKSWNISERLIERLCGQELPVGGTDAIDQLLSPILESLGEEARADLAAGERTGQKGMSGFVDRKGRRLVRLGADLVRGRPLNRHPERNPSKLTGVTAIRLALVGIVTKLRTGEDYGEVDDGVWFVGAVDSFYDKHLEHIARYAVAPAPAPPSIDGMPANSFPDAKSIEPLPKDGTKGHLLEREALSFGLSSVRFPNGTFVVSDDHGRQMNFKWGRSPIASGVSLSICSYKEATRRLLKRVEVPVPSGRVFAMDDVNKALEYADRIGYPVVCKPVAGLRGIGVVADIRSRQELVNALELYKQSELGSDDFVIEQHVPGEDYRIVVIDGRVVAAVVREPASVTGDGVHTIADLVEYKNRARLLNPHLSSRLIKFSEAMRYQLAQQGLTVASVPESGRRVLLANSANLSQGGDSFEVADELHPSLKDLAVRAVEAVPGLGFCGLDMLIEDHRLPLDRQQATVIELNAHAAIGSAQYPMWGTPTPVARLFFRAAADQYGISLPERPADTLSVKIEVRGKVTGVAYRRWLRRRAELLGIAGSVQNAGERKVIAHLQGQTDAVAALVYLASRGPRRAIPTSVTTTHCEPFHQNGFKINRGRLHRVPRPVRRLVKRVRHQSTRNRSR